VEIYQVYSWNIYGKSIYLVYTRKNFLGVPDGTCIPFSKLDENVALSAK
jgi:hypothetical protein